METKRIRTEGRRRDGARNERRVTVELTTSVRGVVIQGHHVTGPDPVPSSEVPEPRTSRIEVYLDRLDAVAERVQTPEQLEQYALAQKICDNRTADWLKSNERRMVGMSAEAKAGFTHRNCNIRPGLFVGHVGLPLGLPPIEKMGIVGVDQTTVIPYAAFLELDSSERDAFLLAPPKTDANEMERTGQIIADSIARAMAAATAKAESAKPPGRNKPGK